MEILSGRARIKKRIHNVIIVACLLEQQEKKLKRRRIWVDPLWQHRLTEGEFHLRYPRLRQNPNKFYDYYGMNIVQFDHLLVLVRPALQKQNTKFRLSISVEERLTVCLRFVTSSLSCKKLAHNFLMGYETIRIIVKETTKAMWKILLPIVMPVPTKEMWQSIEQDFADKCNYPNCVGAIDGKHVVVQAPRKSGTLYFNYKKTFSVVLLAIADANYKFIVVDVGSYGRNSDGGIFASSTFGKNLLRQQLDLPDDKMIPGILNPMPHVFIGDEAFPISKNMMRPYPKEQVHCDQTKKVYNYRHSRARRVVEQSFGMLAQKFEIYQKRIKFQPNQLENLVLATVCLHNYILDGAVHVPSTPNNRARNLRDLDHINDQGQLEPITIRDNFKQYFNSTGALSWQLDLVNRH